MTKAQTYVSTLSTSTFRPHYLGNTGSEYVKYVKTRDDLYLVFDDNSGISLADFSYSNDMTPPLGRSFDDYGVVECVDMSDGLITFYGFEGSCLAVMVADKQKSVKPVVNLVGWVLR